MKKETIKKGLITLACIYGLGSTIFFGSSYMNERKVVLNQKEIIHQHEEDLVHSRKETEKLNGELSDLILVNEATINDLDYARQRIIEAGAEIGRVESEISRIELENQTAKKSFTRGASRGGISSTRINVETSAYCSCYLCSEGWGDQTADGSGVSWGVIAAPQELPFGTQMTIDGFGDTIFTVADRGGAIYKFGDTYRIDIWFSNHADALAYGRRSVSAYIH